MVVESDAWSNKWAAPSQIDAQLGGLANAVALFWADRNWIIPESA